MATKKERNDVLKYTEEAATQGTVRAHYDDHRAEVGLPMRCDIPECQLHTGPLLWNGKPLTLIIDHIDGCNTNNSTHNLRYLCPNCNQQQPTTGGGNVGRIIEKAEDGYSVRERGETRRVINRFLGQKLPLNDSADGKTDDTAPPEKSEGDQP